MARYIARPHHAALIDDPEWGVAATSAEIIMPEDSAIDTGLLDAHGRRIWRCRERIRLGFTED